MFLIFIVLEVKFKRRHKRTELTFSFRLTSWGPFLSGTSWLKRPIILLPLSGAHTHTHAHADTCTHTYTVHIKPVLIRIEVGHLCPGLWHFLLWPYKPHGYPESLGIHVRARACGNTPVSTLLHWDQLALKFQSFAPAVWT